MSGIELVDDTIIEIYVNNKPKILDCNVDIIVYKKDNKIEMNLTYLEYKILIELLCQEEAMMRVEAYSTM